MKRILFVCVENSCRSQMAEAFARIYGKEKADVNSAGSRPSGQIHPKAIEAMWEIGYDLTRHTSKSLKEVPDIEYDAVITMGCGEACPSVRGKRREDWMIPDPKHLSPRPFREIRNSIERRVKDLLKELGAL
ncbi:MAG: arsenate reductase ArsC [Candidatus Manganitrophaceae bacterium]|nr:MAG: arsenate reductase ArsC [Candidatus Manganitrophaceae bacterium]